MSNITALDTLKAFAALNSVSTNDTTTTAAPTPTTTTSITITTTAITVGTRRQCIHLSVTPPGSSTFLRKCSSRHRTIGSRILKEYESDL